MTQTLAVELRAAIGVHHTATDDGAWDGPGNEARLSNDAGAAKFRQAFAWQDPDLDPDTKQAYKFIHHMVSTGGDVGAANLRGCAAGIGALNGARGGTTIPDSDRAGVHRHLAAHLMDGDMTPPDLRAATSYMERVYFPAEELRVTTDGAGNRQVSWYAAVFNSLSEDLGGFREYVNRRAFTKTIAEGDVRALFNHNPDLVLGRNRSGTLALKTDLKGLNATVTPPDTSWARDLMISLDRGDINSGSFGFQVVQQQMDPELSEDGLPIRQLKEVKLFDVSLVTFPAYPATEGVSLRSMLAEFELDDILPPLLRARAGVTPTTEERKRYWLVMERLRAIGPEPPEPDPATAETEKEKVSPDTADDGHSLGLATRRRHLELLRLRQTA